MQSSLRPEKIEPHQKCQAGDPLGGDYKGPQLHREQPACDAGSGHGGTETCSDACSDAQSTAMCP